MLIENIATIAVSKKQNVASIREVYANGYRDFGENYLQEALSKQQQLKDLDITWHFIGPIQSNKTKEIANNFSWIHSIDRIKIAKRLNAQTTKKINVLIQVNIQNETSKKGVLLDDLTALIQTIQELENLELKGLMCIPDKNNSEEAFAKMATLKNQYQLEHLSMGMSSDYLLAIKYGATMIRLGTKIFGARK